MTSKPTSSASRPRTRSAHAASTSTRSACDPTNTRIPRSGRATPASTSGSPSGSAGSSRRKKNAHPALHVDDVPAARQARGKGVAFIGDILDTGVGPWRSSLTRTATT